MFKVGGSLADGLRAPTTNPAALAARRKKRRSTTTSQTLSEDTDQHEFAYWVVGRAFAAEDMHAQVHTSDSAAPLREFYVCFRDGTSQNIVEMAFKLHFGYVV